MGAAKATATPAATAADMISLIGNDKYHLSSTTPTSIHFRSHTSRPLSSTASLSLSSLFLLPLPNLLSEYLFFASLCLYFEKKTERRSATHTATCTNGPWRVKERANERERKRKRERGRMRVFIENNIIKIYWTTLSLSSYTRTHVITHTHSHTYLLSSNQTARHNKRQSNRLHDESLPRREAM